MITNKLQNDPPIAWRDIIDISGINNEEYRQMVERVLDYRYDLPDGQERLSELKEALGRLPRQPYYEQNPDLLTWGGAKTPDAWPDMDKIYISDQGKGDARLFRGRVQITFNEMNLMDLGLVTSSLSVEAFSLNEFLEHELGHVPEAAAEKPMLSAYALGGSPNFALSDLRDLTTDLEPTNPYRQFVDLVEKEKANAETPDETLAVRNQNAIAGLERIKLEKKLLNELSDKEDKTPVEKAFVEYTEVVAIHEALSKNYVEDIATDRANILIEPLGRTYRDDYRSVILLSKPLDSIRYYTSDEKGRTLDLTIDEPLSDAEKEYFTYLNAQNDEFDTRSINITDKENTVLRNNIDQMVEEGASTQELLDTISRLKEAFQATPGDDFNDIDVTRKPRER